MAWQARQPMIFGQHGFAHTRIADKDQIGAFEQEVQVQQFQDSQFGLLAGFMMGEIERVDGVLRLQARHLHPPFDRAAAASLQFQIGQPLQGGRQAKILVGRVSDGLIQMTAHRRQAELFEFLGECNHRVVSFRGKSKASYSNSDSGSVTS